nr:hypothetical protein [Lentibacillus sp. JNUCC-1]
MADTVAISRGKGVVVYLATVLVLEPVVLLPVGIISLFGLLVKRLFTVIGLIALVTVPVAAAFLSGVWQGGIFMIMLIIVIWAHLKE